jgi:uncharacterized protein (DUF1501 family)
MLTRRQTLALCAGCVAGASLGGVRAAVARAATEKRLVVVVLRGALDGLAAVPPLFDPDYRRMRGALALAEPGTPVGALDLDGRFGLHPALQPLHAMYRAGEMSVVHAVATPYRSRSHFDGQDVLENGASTVRTIKDGWLNRTLSLMNSGDTGRLGLAVGQSVPLILRGDTKVATWAPAEMPGLDPDFLSRLAGLYANDALLGPALDAGRRAQAMTDEVMPEGRARQGRMSGGRVYVQARPPASLRDAAMAVGQLLAASDGPRIAALDMGGWDTHAGQGVLNGRLAGALRGLGEGLSALKVALGPAWRETVVAVITEFGRTVAINGTGGTDHGTGGVAFLLGGAVSGGRVVTRWPGLAAEKLYEGCDLAPTTDLRSVVKGVLSGHLGLPQDAIERVVFPDSGDAPPLRDSLRA